MANPFVHVELNTGDLANAKKFYQKVFDWKLAEFDMGGGMAYTTIAVGKGVAGGMQQKPMPDAPTMWLPYVEVDSVKRTIAKAKKNGANVVVDFMKVGNMGALGIFIDPTGAALGIWQSAPKPKAVAKKTPAKKARGRK